MSGKMTNNDQLGKILVVDDYPDVRDIVERCLVDSGYRVWTCEDGSRVFDIVNEKGIDLAIVDLMLPDTDGLMLTRKLKEHSDIGVVILSGRGETTEKIIGLEIGADDYVTKPFHREELVARIHAVVRRSKGHSQSVIRTGKLAVNLDAKTVEVDGARVHLTGKEYAMLELLSLRKGTTLTKEMFLNHLYGGMDEPELKIIDVFICKLRKKRSHACGGENYIETVWAAAMCCAIRTRRRKPPDPLIFQYSTRLDSEENVRCPAAPGVFL